MPEANNLDTGFLILVCLIAIPLVLGLLSVLCLFIMNFSRELRYINCEIGRNVGAERRHWIRKRRRLWLSLIPFVKFKY